MNPTFQHATALLPLMITAAAAVVAMLGIAWRRCHGQTFLITVIGLVAALISAIATVPTKALPETPLLTVDPYASFFMVLVLIAAIACAVFAYAYLHRTGNEEGYTHNQEEFYLLLILATAGGLVLACARHFGSLFIGLELLSVPLYGMIGYAFFKRNSLEASMKYLVLSAAGSAFILFGMALWYAEVGHLGFAALAKAGLAGPLAQTGLAMMLVGFGFKISLVPFHIWTPDVYEGAPAPAATFLATASKVAIFAVLLRLFEAVPLTDASWLRGLLVALGILSMLAGNLLALLQTNLKRLLGYSSVAHFGYLLIVLAAEAGQRTETAGVYLATYVFTSLVAFGVVSLVSSPFSNNGERAAISDYRGLFQQRPGLAVAFAIAMLSLTGIPLTAGFIGKFYVVALGVNTHLWWMVGALIVGSAISLYYYLRAMVAPFLKDVLAVPAPVTHGSQHLAGLVILVASALVILLGLYPQPLLALAQAVG